MLLSQLISELHAVQEGLANDADTSDEYDCEVTLITDGFIYDNFHIIFHEGLLVIQNDD